ncbi:RNA-binding cell elongation regulator Jag/EloR [Tumebacillus permanentifrigoris]|uniref:RNA-binding protein KhpB n=1 Tax=Tumebacillus permanentifrigoris TaxID=378543 RepID=A0A316DG23_9BACL|nr:spoIIIJ-associated protein [Tumebacillus permanentifrigoris]
MKKVITTGKTVELATELALNKLGLSRDRVDVTILTQPSRGLFGLFGKRDAEVLVEELAQEVLAPDPIGETRKFLEEVFAAMNLRDLTLTVEEEQDNSYLFRMKGESIGVLIGRRGATLDSLQYLVNLVANKHSDTFLRISLDAEDYRKRRQETLERLADRLAKKAVQSRREVVLEPMGSVERKVIHSYLQDRSNILTYSQGEEPYRKVVIAPRGSDQKPRRKPASPHQQKSQSGTRRSHSKSSKSAVPSHSKEPNENR